MKPAWIAFGVLVAGPALADDAWLKLPRHQQDVIITLEVAESSAATCGVALDPEKYARIHHKQLIEQGASPQDADRFLSAFRAHRKDLLEIDPLPKADPRKCSPSQRAVVDELIRSMTKGVFPTL